MTIFLCAIFLLQVILFVYLDYQKFNSVYTPVTFLGIPFSVVLVLTTIFSTSVGFVPLHEYAVIVWIIGIFLFWFSGNLLASATVLGPIPQPFGHLTVSLPIVRCIQTLSWLALSILLLNCIRAYIQHGTIGSEAFSSDFAGGGIAGHCLNIMKFNAAYLCLSTRSRNIPNVLIVLATFIFLLLYNVKGGIILTIAVCFFSYYIASGKKVQLGRLLLLVITGVSIFVLSYALSLGRHLNLNFILYHFFAYISAGLLGLGEHLRLGLPVDTDFMLIFQPLRNTFLLLLGNGVHDKISDLWVSISYLHEKQSNVKTLIGDIYVYGGVLKGGLVISYLGLLSYFFLILSILLRSSIFLILYLFWITSLMLGWFNFPFNSIFYYEIIVYAFIVYGISCLSGVAGEFLSKSLRSFDEITNPRE